MIKWVLSKIKNRKGIIHIDLENSTLVIRITSEKAYASFMRNRMFPKLEDVFRCSSKVIVLPPDFEIVAIINKPKEE